MIPLVDIHVHLLAGLDDGPRTPEDALAMCFSAYAEGVRLMAATAHQNERWSAVTPERIRQATEGLRAALTKAGLALQVVPCAEVTAQPETAAAWQRGTLLSVADKAQYLLLEMPHGVFVDLRPTVAGLRRAGIRPILAHPERQPELLHEPGVIEGLIAEGCLVQVSSASVTDPKTGADMRALKSWFKRGIVHFLGSDGHSPRRRPPHMAAAYRTVARWAGTLAAERVCSANGMTVLNGLSLRVAPPAPRPRVPWWLPRLW
jgi:protein-tyrosine phosphatase